jgi:hypothetical protein
VLTVLARVPCRDGTCAKFVFSQINPAATDGQIAKRWKTKIASTVMACHRASTIQAKVTQEKERWAKGGSGQRAGAAAGRQRRAQLSGVVVGASGQVSE